MLPFLRDVDALDVFGGPEGHRYAVLYHEDVPEIHLALIQKIDASGYIPTAIVGIVRWGNTVANYLSDKYRVSVYSVGATSYTDVFKKREVRITQRLGVNLKGQKVILADDVGDSGETFSVVKEKEVMSANPEEVKTACLVKKPWTNPVPDYWVEETSRWVLFPDKHFENCRHLFSKRPSDLSLEDAKKIILRELRYSSEVVNEVSKEFQ